MTSYFSVVQCVPNPISGERMNVGVIAFDDRRMLTKFTNNWKRLNCIGIADPQFIRDFAENLSSANNQFLPTQQRLMAPFGAKEFTADLVARASREWGNAIQLTTPRASTLAIEDLLEEAVEIYLRVGLRVDSSNDRAGRRTKTSVISAAESVLHQAVANRFGERTATRLITKDVKLQGREFPHRPDFGLKGALLYWVGYGISFEIQDWSELDTQVRKLLFNITDIHNRTSINYEAMPLSVLAVAPDNADDQYLELYESLSKAAKQNGAEFIDEDKNSLVTWADHVAARIPSQEARELVA